MPIKARFDTQQNTQNLWTIQNWCLIFLEREILWLTSRKNYRPNRWNYWINYLKSRVLELWDTEYYTRHGVALGTIKSYNCSMGITLRRKSTCKSIWPLRISNPYIGLCRSILHSRKWPTICWENYSWSNERFLRYFKSSNHLEKKQPVHIHTHGCKSSD